MTFSLPQSHHPPSQPLCMSQPCVSLRGFLTDLSPQYWVYHPPELLVFQDMHTLMLDLREPSIFKAMWSASTMGKVQPCQANSSSRFQRYFIQAQEMSQIQRYTEAPNLLKLTECQGKAHSLGRMLWWSSRRNNGLGGLLIFKSRLYNSTFQKWKASQWDMLHPNFPFCF